MRYEPIVPDGQHLGASRQVDDASSGLLFDDETNELVGHAAWRAVEDPPVYFGTAPEPAPPRPELTPEEREQLEMLVALLVLAVVRGVVAAAPHVQRWWSEKVVPATRALRSKMRRGRRPRAESAASVPVENNPTFIASAEGVAVAAGMPEIRLSGAEWEQRYRAVLALDAFTDEQRRILALARGADDAPASVLTTAREFADRIRATLETRPIALLDGRTPDALTALLTAAPVATGRAGAERPLGDR